MILAPPPGMAPIAAPAKKSGGDLQNELMNALNDPNLRNRLRKVKPKDSSNGGGKSIEKEVVPLTEEEKRLKEEKEHQRALEEQERKMAEERENLIVEMLGFMETPNGSIEDLVDRAVKNTTIERGFLYTLVRRKWAKAYRVKITYPEESNLPKGKKKKFVPCTVFPGIQWTSAIEIPDETAENLEIKYPDRKNYIGAGHMYRFDQSIQRHVLDEIALYKDTHFPPPLIPFTRPEPPQDSSLENRNKWEIWNKKKLAHQQSESAQYDLIYNKLIATDQTLVGCFSQLEETILQIREMNAAVTDSFSDLPLSELRQLVLSIPSQIKQVAKNLHDTNGIIIKDSDLKLTPAFIKSLSNPSVKEGSGSIIVVDSLGDPASATRDAVLASHRKQGNNRESFVNFGGLPAETVIPLFQSIKAREDMGLTMDKKARRRLTMW